VFQREDQTYAPYAGKRTGSTKLRFIAKQVNWALVAGFMLAMAGTLYMTTLPGLGGIGTFCFVLVGWVFSLTVHEFAHAATAFLSGDTSTSTIRYLSGNPLNYINPLLSIGLPLLFVLLGGIGLPGGAVYLQTQNIHDRNLRSAVSLAGPLSNLVFLGALVALLRVGMTFGLPGFTYDTGFATAAALGLLAFFQLSAVLLNLIPIPGLDGYGAVEPYLSYQTRQSFEAIRPYGFIILFGLFWLVPPFYGFFFGVVDTGLSLFGVDPGLAGLGFSNFRFWIH
jgi:Zn-dependent protease